MASTDGRAIVDVDGSIYRVYVIELDDSRRNRSPFEIGSLDPGAEEFAVTFG